VRRLIEDRDGYDRTVWKRTGEELGLTGLAIPTSYGGAGFGLVELGIAVEEMGRALFCAPFFGSAVLATQTLLRCHDEPAKHALLPGLASGEIIASLALTEEDGHWDADGVRLGATRAGDGWTLTGEKLFVLDGLIADVILVVGRTSEEPGVAGDLGLFLVDGAASGLNRSRMNTLDGTRPMARLRFDATPARPLAVASGVWPIVERVLDIAAAVLAAEQVGGAQRVLEMAANHARERIQFGRPIGSFQAIKHKCADMLVEVEAARSAAYRALAAAEAGQADLPLLASVAKAYCSEAYLQCATDNIQVHGGIGFTWEHPAHLYFRRAKSSELLFGDPTYHRGLVADRAGI